jgi:hypothetical protein
MSRAACIIVLGCCALSVLSAAAPACSQSPSELVPDASATGDTGTGTGASDAGPDACPATGPDCYPVPLPADASSLMILNACTDAQAFDPAPSLPLLGPCGKLPPLP